MILRVMQVECSPYLLCIHMPGSELGSVSAVQSLSQLPQAHFHLYMFCTKKKQAGKGNVK